MSEILANCATCGLEINEDTGTPCGRCGDAYCAAHFFGPAGQAQANDREFCALCEALDAADSVPTETPAQLLEAERDRFKKALAEIASDFGIGHSAGWRADCRLGRCAPCTAAEALEGK